MGQLTDISVRSKREMFGAIHIQSIYLTSALQMAEIGREKPHEVDDFWRKSLNIKQIYFSGGIFTHWWFRMLKIQRPCCASILLHSLASIDSLLLGCIVEAFARRFNDTEEWRKKYNCSLAFVVFCLSIFFCWCVCVYACSKFIAAFECPVNLILIHLWNLCSLLLIPFVFWAVRMASWIGNVSISWSPFISCYIYIFELFSFYVVVVHINSWNTTMCCSFSIAAHS